MKTQNRKIAWITGGGTGIGKGLTRILVNNQWHVIISGRRLKKINQTKSLNTKNITALQLDISSEKQCKKIVQTIVKRFKKIDLVVLNAAAYNPGMDVI